EGAKSLPENNAGKPNNITDMVQAGARGNPNQVKQLVATLGLMLDHNQETMTEPVRGNYAEGLDSGEHFAHMYSQRKGMIDKSQSVSGPGYLAKELTNIAAGQTIQEKDCGTNHGRQEDVDRHLLHRVLMEPVNGVSKGDVIDETALEKLKKSNRDQVEVRSLFECQTTDGVCARCFGQDEDGHFPEIGERKGLSEVQAMTERSTQLPMKSFHSGGVATAEAGIANAFDRAKEILEMPQNVSNKATLAETSGRVERIEDSGFGGKKVFINGQAHEIPEGRDLEVKQGDRVEKGDKLCGGVVKPQELLEHKGVEDVQHQIRDDLHETFSQAGVNLQKKNHEMTAKMLTEKVRVTDPGDSDQFVPGDFTTLAKVKQWNKNNPNKQQIEYKSMLAGAQQHPHKGDDWAQRMSLNRLRQTMEEGAGMGYESSRKHNEGSPFADIALGPNTSLVEPGEEATDRAEGF
ncbi:MAG: hypothetical protein ABEN55_09295, partial [Bradymonadaceae bacterium]